MSEIKTEITLTATPQRVWEVLTNFDAYPSWSTFLDKITGEAKEGNQLNVTITPIGKKSMNFSSKLLTVKPLQELRWCGVLGHALLFRGEHYFILQQEGDKTCFIHGEKFTGILLPILNLFNFIENTKKGFEAFNTAFKKHVEA